MNLIGFLSKAKRGATVKAVVPSSLACLGWLLSPENAGTLDNQYGTGLTQVAPDHIPHKNSMVEFMHGKQAIAEANKPRFIQNNLSCSVRGADLKATISRREQAMQDAGYLVVKQESDVYNPCDQIDISTEIAFNVACNSSPEDVMRRYAEVLFASGLAENTSDAELEALCAQQLDALDAFDNTDIAVEWQRRPYRGSLGLFGEEGVYYGDEQGWEYENAL